MTSTFRTLPLPAVSLLLALSLTACGGGGDASADAAGIDAADLAAACDTSLFSGGVATPTLEQALPFASTYNGEEGTYSDDFVTFTKTADAALQVSSDGSVVYKGNRVEVKSVCYESSTNTLYLHWGTKTVGGAGAVYDNHVDLRNGGSTFSGPINGLIFRKPVLPA